jgi:hypothetical protein
MAIVTLAIGITTAVAAEPAADPSDVVVALDYSQSILDDKPNRTRFADALVEIADRVEVTRDDLVNGDAVISLVPFASRARGYPGCEGLALHQDPAAVDQLADCLRLAARQYRRGPNAPIVSTVGTDTNYVAALREAARIRPRTEATGDRLLHGRQARCAASRREVLPEAERLFGDRTPFAFLPVGMGLDPRQRVELRSGLEGLAALTHDMTPCPGGEAFHWDDVVFRSPVEAGHAVADALEQVTCSFTVAPSPTPKPTPTPTPEVAPGLVSDVHATAGDGFIELSWAEPADPGTAPVDAYQARCRGEGRPTGCRHRSCRRPSTRRWSTMSTTEPRTRARWPPSARSAPDHGRPPRGPLRRPVHPQPLTVSTQTAAIARRLSRSSPARTAGRRSSTTAMSAAPMAA